jgi:hypothetical protein
MVTAEAEAIQLKSKKATDEHRWTQILLRKNKLPQPLRGSLFGEK